jgi:hypothetical protein
LKLAAADPPYAHAAIFRPLVIYFWFGGALTFLNELRRELFVKRWAKILSAVVGIIVAVAALIPVFVNANTFRPEIERQLNLRF